MKTTVENNKIIAEFMGFKPARCRNGFAWDNNKIIKPISLHGSLINSGNNGKFHTSWDWLMPVIEHILTICAEDDELEKYAVITDSVPFIDQTYFEVVQFIEWYNENKN